MKPVLRTRSAGALALAFLAVPALAAGPYTANTSGTTANGQLEALSEAVDDLDAIKDAVSPASASNASGVITTGGTFQTIAAANASRKAFEFVNICNVSGNCTTTSNRCYLYIAASGTPSSAKAIAIPAGGSYLRTGVVPSDAIAATCDGTGDKFYLAVQ